MARLVVLAVALLCALPAVAHAQSFSVPTRMQDANFRPGIGVVTPEGPAVAANSVLWWDRPGDRAVLRVASATSEPRAVLRLRPRSYPLLRVAAFGNRAIAQAGGTFYDIDVPSGTVRQMDPCFGDAACAGCRDRTGSTNLEYELVGTVLATGQTIATVCQSGAVHDYADGATRRFAGAVLAAAGTYAVVREATEMALYNWRTGQRLRTLGPGPFSDDYWRQVAVDEHGTVVFADLASRALDDPFGGEDTVRLAGGLLAQRRLIADEDFDEEWGQRSHSRFWVSRPDGSATRRLRGQRWGGSWDFDGRRLAWAAQPCMEVRIQVWDLAGDPPPLASERCGLPRIRNGTVRLDRDQDELLFKATCPRRPVRGCDADMRATLSLRRGGRRITPTNELPAIHMPAGTTDGRWLNVDDSRKLRSVRGALRARFIIKSHGRRKVVTRDVRR
jgi:hypothetical protein